MDHGSQDHVVDRRNVINRPADANFQQLAANLNMEVRLGEPLADLADQLRRLPEGSSQTRWSAIFRVSSVLGCADLICCASSSIVTLNFASRPGLPTQAATGR